MKIDNSKESAIMSGSWSKPGASFYNNLMNEDNYQSLINEAFLISDDVDKDTTFAQSGCKYPHHVIKDDTLVVSAPGIKAAYSRARQMGVYKGDVKEHLDKHMRELGYLDKKGVHYEEIMEENFQYIESVIDSALGTNLVMMESELQEYDEMFDEYISESVFDEASHGSLKHSFRLCVNVENGHMIRVTFDLDPNSVVMAGDHTNQGGKAFDKLEYLKQHITKTGSGDFSSIGTVQGITDLDTGKPLTTVRTCGIIGSDPNSVRFTVPSEYMNQAKDGVFSTLPVAIREKIAASSNIKNSPKGIITFTVGQKETTPSYKSTRALSNTAALFNNQFSAIKGFHNPDKMELRHNPYAKGNLDIKNNPNYTKFSNMSMDKFMQWATPRIAKLDTYIQTNEKNIPRSKLWAMDDAVESFDRLKKRYEKNKNEKFNQVVSNPSYSDMAATVIDGISKMTESAYVEEDNIEELEEWMDTVITEGWDAVDEFDEKSHGLLKFDFRLGWDAKTGNQIKVVYSLQDINVTDVGDFYYNYAGKKDGATHDSHLDYTRKNITRKGNTDHQSTGQKVLAIIDMVTKKRLPEVDLLNPFCRYIDTHSMTQPAENLKAANDYARSNPDSKTHIKAGEIDNSKTFKSTAWAKGNTTDQNGEDFRFQQIASSEELKHGRGWDIHNIIPKRFRLAGQNDGGFIFKQNPTKEEAIEELQVRYEDNKRMINYMNRQIANGNNDPRAKEYVEWLKKNNDTIQKDYSTIKAGSYDVSMMKKYREATEYSESYINSLMDSMLPAHTIEEETDEDFRESVEVFDEKSHGDLKYCYRIGFDAMTGEEVAVQFEIPDDPEFVTKVGDPNLTDKAYYDLTGTAIEDRMKSKIHDNAKDLVRKTFKKLGHIDFITKAAKVKGIIKRIDANNNHNHALNPSMTEVHLIPLFSKTIMDILNSFINTKGMNMLISYRQKTGNPKAYPPAHDLLTSDAMKKYIVTYTQSNSCITEYYKKDDIAGEGKYKTTKLIWDRDLFLSYKYTPAFRGYMGDREAGRDEDIKDKADYLINSLNNRYRKTPAEKMAYKSKLKESVIDSFIKDATNTNDSIEGLVKFMEGMVSEEYGHMSGMSYISHNPIFPHTIHSKHSYEVGIPDYEKIFFEDTQDYLSESLYFYGYFGRQMTLNDLIALDNPEVLARERPICVAGTNIPVLTWRDLVREIGEGAMLTLSDPDITDKWFIKSDDGVDNCCISVKGYDKPMRGRSAMITLQLQEDDNWYILCKKNADDYGVPGGGWNKNESPKHAAIRELQEETLSNVKNVKRMGTLIEYSDTVKDWVKEHVPNKDDWWYGYYSAIFVGIYNGKYNGKVKDQDRESGYAWKKIDHKLLKSLPKEYADAINDYINKDNPFKESVFTEAEEDEKPEEKDILDEPIEDDPNQQDPPPIEDNERNDVNANNMPDHSADSGPANDSNTTGGNTARPQDMDKEGNEADRGDGQGDPSTVSREGLDSKVGGEPTPPTIKTPISRPKQFANQEQDKNGVRRKNLYIEFIRWAKEYNPKNIFGSNFDKDIFTGSYPFVPDEMRYFYRLADPTLCILAGGLTFFPVIQLRKLNAENKHLDQYMIFAATDTDMRVFSNVDKRVYMATEQNGEIVLGKALANTFDTYIQIMIDKGDILNGPREDTTLEYVEDME